MHKVFEAIFGGRIHHIKQKIKITLSRYWRKLQKNTIEIKKMGGERPSILEPSLSTPSPRPHYDAGGAQIGKFLYVICGYNSLSMTNSEIQIFDLEQQIWLAPLQKPETLADSHCAIITDELRYIYFVSGQLGPECSPAIRDCLVLDTETQIWSNLPPLPEARYAGTLQLWNGRLHFAGGAIEDRYTASNEHWSLGIIDGKNSETSWVAEAPLPVATMHFASAILNGALYYFGGQQGDFVAKEGSKNFKCTAATNETYLKYVYRLDCRHSKWVRQSDMPFPVSHIEFSNVIQDESIRFFGGQVYKCPKTFHLKLTNAIYEYDSIEDRWAVVGGMPQGVKTPIVGKLNDDIFACGGQMASENSPTPGAITNQVIRFNAGFNSRKHSKRSDAKCDKPQKILFVIHEMSLTGAPLIAIQTACELQKQGFEVCITLASGEHDNGILAERYSLGCLMLEQLEAGVESADVIVLNSTHHDVSKCAVRIADASPNSMAKIVWWVHENEPATYPIAQKYIGQVGTVVLDSKSCLSAWEKYTRSNQNIEVIYPAVTNEYVTLARSDRHQFVLPDEDGNVFDISAAQIREYLGVAEGDILILNIGTFSKRKGSRMLVRTLASAAQKFGLPIKLLLIGMRSTAERDRLLHKLDPGERAILTPKTLYGSTPFISGFYAAADLYVSNTQGQDGVSGEPFGLSTIQALIAGLPVLATRAGGAVEILEDEFEECLFDVGTDGQNQLEELVKHMCFGGVKVTQLKIDKSQASIRSTYSFDRFYSEFVDVISERYQKSRR